MMPYGADDLVSTEAFGKDIATDFYETNVLDVPARIYREPSTTNSRED